MRTIVTLLSRIFKRQPAAFEQSTAARTEEQDVILINYPDGYVSVVSAVS